MNRLILTNYRTYQEIADEAYQNVVKLGSPGGTTIYDPKRNSYKQSMISIVFTGIWLDAILHLLIVSKFGIDKFKDYDRKTYEDKLELLGCREKELISRVMRFRRTRKILVHEKAFDDNDFRSAQVEAENAHEMLIAIKNHFSGELV